MSTRDRSTTTAKKAAATAVKPPPSGTKQRRPALSNITNQENRFSSVSCASKNRSKSRVSSTRSNPMLPCVTKIAKKNEHSTCTHGKGLSGSISSASLSVTSDVHVPLKDTFSLNDEPTARITAFPAASDMDTILATATNVFLETGSMDMASNRSVGDSVSLDETMSMCSSLRSPGSDYVVSNCDLAVENKTANNLYLSDNSQNEENICSRIVHMDREPVANVIDIDDNVTDPQYCATIACDIYKNLRESEAKKRPSMDFLERIQKDINSSMRAILIDWLVEVSEEYRLVPETLFLTVNYIDRYLSGNEMNRQQLQLLGVACMMIASKYEEISAPPVEEFCYITDNTYSKEEVLQMESSVLNYLKFEMTAPTATCFLRRFVHAAQKVNEVPSIQLECLAYYLVELSLLEYRMLRYAPSLIAASAIFLARFMLSHQRKPWSPTLQQYTLYQPSELYDCVKELHHLCRTSHHPNLPAVREKYSQHKYKFVAKKCCPSTIPLEYFQDPSE